MFRVEIIFEFDDTAVGQNSLDALYIVADVTILEPVSAGRIICYTGPDDRPVGAGRIRPDFSAGSHVTVRPWS